MPAIRSNRRVLRFACDNIQSGNLTRSESESDASNRTVMTACTQFRIYLPRSSVERFYVTRKMGGRDNLDVKTLCYSQISKSRDYSTINQRIVACINLY